MLLVAIVAARVAFTYPVAAAATWLVSCGHSRQQQRRISWLDATVILWGGLARGAITLALAYHTFAPARKGVPTADHQVGSSQGVLLLQAGQHTMTFGSYLQSSMISN